MKRFRFRLSTLLWLVAIAAAFLAGMRYGEYRAPAARGKLVISNIRLSAAESEAFHAKLKVFHAVKPSTKP
jgi:hypothetical protein